MTTTEANAIIDEVRVSLDDGSGDLIATFIDAAGNAQLPFSASTRTYSTVLEVTTTYPSDPARNGIVAIHLTHITEAGSTAEVRPSRGVQREVSHRCPIGVPRGCLRCREVR